MSRVRGSATSKGRLLRRTIGFGLFSLYGAAAGWALVFLSIEPSPALLDVLPLQEIRYYAQKRDYVFDPSLVIAYRRTNYVRRARFIGDLYSPHYGVPAKAVEYVATYDANGFRKNSSQPPYDLAVIGDSYVEFGESDQETFTEILKHMTGLSVANFGRGWYGPFQYLEVLRRHVLQARPKYILLAVFAGNDFNDISQYRAWLDGKAYYWFKDLDKLNLVSRFVSATGDMGRFFTGRIRTHWNSEGSPKPSDSKFGVIRVGDKEVPMVLARWEREITKEEITALRSILREFKSLCDAHGIIPLVMYIPTATQVYAEFYSTSSSSRFIERAMKDVGNPSLDAVASVTAELRIELINLLPEFKSRAAAGDLLYYRFDTHWNPEGRRVAATVVASYFGNK